MTAAALLARAGEIGFAVRLDETGPHLVRVADGAVLPPGFLAELRRHRGAVVAHLSCRACGKPTDAKRRCWQCEFRPCSGCDKPTGSVFIETCFSCGLCVLRPGEVPL